MLNKKKERFCFYCGSLLTDFKEDEDNYCQYCGVKLPYNGKKLSPTPYI